MNQPLKAEKTVTINKSAEELYYFWHHFEKLPRFCVGFSAAQFYCRVFSTRSEWGLFRIMPYKVHCVS